MQIIILVLIFFGFTTPGFSDEGLSIMRKNYCKYYRLYGYNAEGKAKIYSRKFHHRKTASGMRFSLHAHTAASVKLPLMSVVRVTNKNNGKSLFVLINDRGPHKTNAILDLSQAAAQKLQYHHKDDIVIEFDIDKTIQLMRDREALKEFNIAS